MTKADETVVLTKDHAIVVPIPGTDREYRLRAPTFGEMGRMSLAMVSTMTPTDTVIADALRDAVKASDLPEDRRAELIGYLDAAEAADEALDDALTTLGPRSEWDDEAKREMRDMARGRRAARKGRDRVEWAMRDAPEVVRLMRHRSEVEHREQIAIIGACLGMTAEQVEALPSADALILRGKALALTRPSADAEKN